MNSRSQVSQTIKESYSQFVQKTKSKYVREALLGATILVALLGGYTLHNWYKKNQNAKAFSGLMEVTKSYEKAVDYERKQQAARSKDEGQSPWEDVDVLLDAASSASSGSSLSPFFLVYEAELTWKQDKDLEKAIQLMKKAVSQFSSSSIYYHIFNLKRIKMALDSQDPEVKKSALIDLNKMAQDPTNYCFEEALYTLSMYHMYNNKSSDAVAAWQRLVENQDEDALVVSPWAKRAQEKLKALGMEVKGK